MSLRSAQDQWVAQELAKALNRVQDPSQLDSTNDVLRQKAQRVAVGCWIKVYTFVSSLLFFDHLWSCIHYGPLHIKQSGCVQCKHQPKFWHWPCRIVLDLREETHQSQREIAEGTSEIWAKCCHEMPWVQWQSYDVFLFSISSTKFFRGFVSVSRRSHRLKAVCS